MKKINRSKLSLDRQTVHNLSAQQLQDAAGGGYRTGYSDCYGSCPSACHSCVSQCLCPYTDPRYGCVTITQP